MLILGPRVRSGSIDPGAAPRLKRTDRWRLTKSGHLAVVTRSSIKARAGGFTGRFETVATSDQVREALQLTDGIDLSRTVQDVWCERAGVWSILLAYGDYIDLLQRPEDGSLTFSGGIEGRDRDWSESLEP